MGKEGGSKSETHRNARIATALWPGDIEVAAEQIGPVLLLARAGFFQRSHAISVQSKGSVERKVFSE